jgi:hypothetical protein
MKVIDAVWVIVLFVIVFVFLMIIPLNTFPWIGDRILNKLREWFEMPLQDMGLLLHLDEISGNTAGSMVQDSSGWKNHGKFCNNPPTWASGKTVIFGASSLVFDGVDDCMEVKEGVENFDRLTSNSITIDFWIKVLDYPNQGCWSNLLNKGNSYQVKLEDDGKVLVNFNINSVTQSLHSEKVLSYRPGIGTHVAITYDNSTGKGKIFINGVEDKVETIGTGNVDKNDDPLIIGGLNPNSPCDGGAPHAVLDEIRIYNKALSGMEIVSHYQNLY